MGKTVIFTKRQIIEAIEADSSYFDDDNMDFQEFNAHTEVATGGKTSNKKDAIPFTTDKFASELAPNAGFMKNRVHKAIPINCSKKKIELTEANAEGENRTWRMPDDIYSQLQYNASNYNGDKNATGWDRLNNLINNPNVGYDEMRRLKNFFDKHAKNEPEHYNLICGDKLKPWVDNSLKSFTGSIASDKKNRSEMGELNVYQKAGGTKDSGNGMGHSTSSITTFDGSVDTF
jgi:hypothetical protein